MTSGDLAQAVRASAAVPLLFAPELRDGRVPHRRRALGQHPGGRRAGRGRRARDRRRRHRAPAAGFDAYSPLLVADRLVQFLFQQPPTRWPTATSSSGPTWTASPASTSPTGTSTDSSSAARRSRGFHAPARPPAGEERLPARALPTRIARVPHARRQRAPSSSPSRGSSASASATRSTTSLCAPAAACARRGVRGLRVRVAHPARRRAIRSSSISSLRRAARRVAGLGLAYDNELGGRMWAGVVDRRFLGLALEGSGARVPRRASPRAVRWGSGGTIRSAASSSIRRSPCGWPTRTSAASTRRARRSARRLHAEAVGFAGIERPLADGWEARGRAWKATLWDEPGRADRSTAGATFAPSEPPPTADGTLAPSSPGPGCTSGPPSRARQRAARRGAPVAAASARLGRGSAAPARLPSGRGRRVSRVITSASAAATAKRCWEPLLTTSRARARCSHASSWPAAEPAPTIAASRTAGGRQRGRRRRSGDAGRTGAIRVRLALEDGSACSCGSDAGSDLGGS